MGNSSMREAERRRATAGDAEGLKPAGLASAPVYGRLPSSTAGEGPYFYEQPESPECNEGERGGMVREIRTYSLTGNAIDVNSRKLPTVFRYGGRGRSVAISCSFDSWKTKIPLVRSRHDFYTIIELPEGQHEYKYFVDGVWVCDHSKDTVSNTFGTENNVIEVKSSDFEVFEALSIDSSESGHSDGLSLLRPNNRSRSPPGDYAQLVPPPDSVRSHGPPILPIHLLQVILNQEVPKHCEPALLPEPSHVMLNHLYALSIKDGVMVLSTTHRYRKKYITTILYKPIP